MTNDELREIYTRSTSRQWNQPIMEAQARAFIAELFNTMTPAGWLAGDGTFWQEEWECPDPDATPVYARPE
jgi:hypothetical protein